VIASVLPMAFVSGLMGPYMSPMPIGASLATLFSLLVALIGPRGWPSASQGARKDEEYRLEDTKVFKFYQRTLTPVLHSSRRSWTMIGFVTALLLVSISLFFFRAVE